LLVEGKLGSCRAAEQKGWWIELLGKSEERSTAMLFFWLWAPWQQHEKDIEGHSDSQMQPWHIMAFCCPDIWGCFNS